LLGFIETSKQARKNPSRSFKMHINYPELVVPSIIGLVCVLYVLPWHIRVRNLATLSMSFWMISLNFIHLVNGK
jgi:prepilin signal peptidase PulO-like enzyme (type II secretory pathway)